LVLNNNNSLTHSYHDRMHDTNNNSLTHSYHDRMHDTNKTTLMKTSMIDIHVHVQIDKKP
jgi:hypothetical protein